jgi:hypothetical protein
VTDGGVALVDAPPQAGASDAAVPDGTAGVPDAAPVDGAAALDATPDLAARDSAGADTASDLPLTIVMAVPILADSYVEQGASASAKNYGKAAILEVKTQAGADNTRIAYLRFSLAPLAGGRVATAAVLRLHGRSSVVNTSESVFGVMDDTWTETGITWNNKPALGTKVATASITTAAQYREWNVLALVKARQAAGRDTVDLAVGMDMDTASGPDTHNSREAPNNPPQLVVTYQ